MGPGRELEGGENGARGKSLMRGPRWHFKGGVATLHGE
jgi:hypothetical protein